MAAKMRPDLEVASVDDAMQTGHTQREERRFIHVQVRSADENADPCAGRSAESGRKPAAFPAGTACLDTSRVPPYPATIPEIVSSTLNPEGDKETIATFKSGDKPTEIIQSYQAKLQESEFKIEAASIGEPGGTIQAQDAEKKRTLILNVDAGETGTLSRVVTGQKK